MKPLLSTFFISRSRTFEKTVIEVPFSKLEAHVRASKIGMTICGTKAQVPEPDVKSPDNWSLVVPMLVVSVLEKAVLSLLVGLVWGSLAAEGWLWNLRPRRSSTAEGGR